VTTSAAWCSGRTVRATATLAWRWARAWAAVAALALPRPATAAPPAGGPVPHEARLARLVDAVSDQARAYRFDEPDVPGERGRIVPVTQALLDSDRVFRAAAMERLAELERSASAFRPARRADLALLRGRLERLAIERDELRRFETDPSRAWPRLDGAIRPLLAGKPGVLCRRLVVVMRRLAAIPEALRAARVDLRQPSRLAVESAMRSFGLTLDLLRRDLPAGLRDCREPGSVAGLAEADTLAGRAIDEYVGWLGRDVLPGADGVWAMGAPTYARWLAAATGEGTPVAEVRSRAERELAALPASGPAAATLRADSLRAAFADSLLDARATRPGRGGSSGFRTVIGRRECAWAWASFAAGLHGKSPKGRPGEPPAFAPSRLDLAATIAEIDLQTGAASFEAARGRLEHDAGIDSLAADREARRAALAPARGVATVGAWQLERVRAEAQSRLGARFSSRAFLAAVIREGAVPAATIREPLLARLGIR